MSALHVAAFLLTVALVAHGAATDDDQRTLPQIMQEKVKRFFEATGTMGNCGPFGCKRSEPEEGTKRFMDSVMGSDCGAFGCKRSESSVEKFKRFMDSVMGSDCGAFGCKRSETAEKLKRFLDSLSERSNEQEEELRDLAVAKKEVEAAEEVEEEDKRSDDEGAKRFVGQLASECGMSCEENRRESPLPEDRSRRFEEELQARAHDIARRFMSQYSDGCDDAACKMAARNAQARAKRLVDILSGNQKKSRVAREVRHRQKRQDFLGMITGGSDYGPFGSNNPPEYGSKSMSYGSPYDYNRHNYGSEYDDDDYYYYDDDYYYYEGSNSYEDDDDDTR